MKKITFLAIACCLVTSVFAQNCDAPFDIVATNTTITSVDLGWNVPQTAVVALTSENYANYTDAKNMRIFAKEGVSISFLANTGANTSDTRVAVLGRSGATGLVLGRGKDVVDLGEDLEATLAFKRFGFLRKRFFGFVGVKARARLAASLVLRTDSK